MGISNGPLNNMVHDWHSLFTGSLWQTEGRKGYMKLAFVHYNTTLLIYWMKVLVCCWPSGPWGDDGSKLATWQQRGLQFQQIQHPLWGCPCRFSDWYWSHLVSLQWQDRGNGWSCTKWHAYFTWRFWQLNFIHVNRLKMTKTSSMHTNVSPQER